MIETPVPPTLYHDLVETRCKRCGIEANPGWLVPAPRQLKDIGLLVVISCLACWSRRVRKYTVRKSFVGREGLHTIAIILVAMTIGVIILPVLKIPFSFIWLAIMLKVFNQTNEYPEDIAERARQYPRDIHWSG